MKEVKKYLKLGLITLFFIGVSSAFADLASPEFLQSLHDKRHQGYSQPPVESEKGINTLRLFVGFLSFIDIISIIALIKMRKKDKLENSK